MALPQLRQGYFFEYLGRGGMHCVKKYGRAEQADERCSPLRF